MESKAAQYLEMHSAQIAWGAGIFVVSLAVSIAAGVFVIIRLPANYFYADASELFWPGRPLWQRYLGIALKNLVGFGLVVLGILMSVPGVPGQGLLTMFIGIVLLDFPGKRALERRIIAIPTIFAALNRVRARFGKLPLISHTNQKSAPETTTM